MGIPGGVWLFLSKRVLDWHALALACTPNTKNANNPGRAFMKHFIGWCKKNTGYPNESVGVFPERISRGGGGVCPEFGWQHSMTQEPEWSEGRKPTEC